MLQFYADAGTHCWVGLKTGLRYAVLVPHNNRHTMDEYNVSVLHCHRHTMLDRYNVSYPTPTQADSVG